jgi:hypothetical protein
MHTTKLGLPDKRFHDSRPEVIARKKIEALKRRNSYIAVIVLGLIAGTILGKTLHDVTHRPILDPRGGCINNVCPTPVPTPSSKLKIQEVQAAEPDWNNDLVGYFRHRGEELDYDEYLITKLHGVMDCENGLHTANRVNYLYTNENGRYTAAGFGMITRSSFNWYKCTGDRFNGVDNINCIYKIYAKDGLRPWNASRKCWFNKVY